MESNKTNLMLLCLGH